MTVAELCAWGKPSILVPLPTAAADHQTQNAEVLAVAGAAIHLPEGGLTPYTFADQVTALFADPSRLESLGSRARGRGHPDATREIVSRILTLVG
jgi:UDP-N-acetylglucosamine--N-acetylmuramyl-(pentapeptide) pyrophosphoryl-undecaprenol N-acetylglucosamine transferase